MDTSRLPDLDVDAKSEPFVACIVCTDGTRSTPFMTKDEGLRVIFALMQMHKLTEREARIIRTYLTKSPLPFENSRLQELVAREAWRKDDSTLFVAMLMYNGDCDRAYTYH